MLAFGRRGLAVFLAGFLVIVVWSFGKRKALLQAYICNHVSANWLRFF